MRNSNVKAIALGGLLAAVAVVIMCLGTFIPVATYICPMLCCMVEALVLKFCGKRIAWTWHAAVCILCMLMAPDKEAAIVFVALGFYPLIKQRLDFIKLGILLKLLYFNIAVGISYAVMICLLGMAQLISENMELGYSGLALLLVLGNITFLLLDRLLALIDKKK